MKSSDTRHLYDMKKVLFDQKWLKTAENFGVYDMRRGLKEKNGLRYDVTTIKAKMLGKEFPKTKGHVHKGGLPELFKVISGKAIYFFQKEKNKNALDAFAIKAKKGDFVTLPSGYGHITINHSRKKLVQANWISNKCKSDYGSFEKMKGACYYYTESGWIKNKNYKKIPELRFEKPLKAMPSNLDFLKQG